MARSSPDVLGIDCAVPGNAPVTALVETRRIHWTDRIATSRMPVLAVGPMVAEDVERADLAEGRDGLIGCWVSPNTAIATVETASAAIVRSAVGQENLLNARAAL